MHLSVKSTPGVTHSCICSDHGERLDLSAEDEGFILIHSLQDANLPKFLAEDVPLFESIMADLFPGIKPPEQDHGVLEVGSILGFSQV